jgi:hypothetical protein
MSANTAMTLSPANNAVRRGIWVLEDVLKALRPCLVTQRMVNDRFGLRQPVSTLSPGWRLAATNVLDLLTEEPTDQKPTAS